MDAEAIRARVTHGLRDQLPSLWHVPPLKGTPLAVAYPPAKDRSWRLILGDGPAPEPVTVHGVTYPPHELAVKLYELARTRGTQIVVFQVNGAGEVEKVIGFDRATPDLAVSWVLRQARKYHREKYGDRPWESYLEAVAKAEAAREAARRAEEERERLENEKREAEARKRAWTVRRGHRVKVSEVGSESTRGER